MKDLVQVAVVEINGVARVCRMLDAWAALSMDRLKRDKDKLAHGFGS